MRRTAMVVMAMVVLASSAQEAPKMPAPKKEHRWLEQFAGEWETESEAIMEPGKPPVKSKGTASTRVLGGFWLVSEIKGDCMGIPVTGLMTVGYDAEKKRYIGTWLCSVDGRLWKYEGKAEGKVLTLETEGPSPAAPDKMCKMRDVLEMKGKDHMVLASFLQTDDGKWVKFMTMNGRRKK